ncbi:MAG: hypothetical protein HYY95_27305 [Candidatus Rokubacteria bacterium]|nr:hypothetical protein [Candidatus Rokubacteria bacterium]
METLIWLRWLFLGGMLALAAMAVAAVTLIDRFRRRRTRRVLPGPRVSVAPAGGRP